MKKFLAILISTILLVSMLPIAVFADNTPSIPSWLTSIGSEADKNAKLNITYTLSEGDQIVAGKTNFITITVTNNGKVIKDAYLTLATSSNVYIESGSIKRSLGTILTGCSESVTFPLACDSTIKEGSYKIDISCEGQISQYPTATDFITLGLTKDDTITDPTTELITKVLAIISKFGFTTMNPTVDTFYVPVTVEGGSGEYTTPRLMLTNYNCGGNVVAGANFGLGLTLRNTSKEDLSNIKVTINTRDFVPVGSSNSFFVDVIKAGESYSKTVTMSCARSLAQAQYAVSVDTEYEDASGQAHTESDQISIPVVQETRLVVDDILDPGWLTMSDTGYANVNYRNMGNNTINNLTIKVEGDFTVEGSNVYYVGNLQSGKSDNYSFSFYPQAEGNCHGTVYFTYEDAEGLEHHINKEFNFNIGPAYNWDEPGMDEPIPEENAGLPLWAKIAIPVAAVVALIIVIAAIKKHKAKKQEALDLDE